MESPNKSYTLHRFEYSFVLNDNKGVFRTNKYLSCSYVILAETEEKANEYFKKEIYIAFLATIDDLLKYNLNHSNIVYSSDKWNPGLLYYDLKPIGDINV